MGCPYCGHGTDATDVINALVGVDHRHAVASGTPYGGFDAGASMIARDVARDAFWDRVRKVVREELDARTPIPGENP